MKELDDLLAYVRHLEKLHKYDQRFPQLKETVLKTSVTPSPDRTYQTVCTEAKLPIYLLAITNTGGLVREIQGNKITFLHNNLDKLKQELKTVKSMPWYKKKWIQLVAQLVRWKDGLFRQLGTKN